MDDGKLPTVEFQRSSAVLDRDGRLVEWDNGFTRELATASPLIVAGASLWDILRAAGANKADIDRRIQGFGWDNAIEYRERGQIVRVEEAVLPSGNVCRVARDVTAERKSEEVLTRARERQQIAATKAPSWLRRDANGRLQ